MTAHNPKPRLTIRLAALVSVALWLSAVSYCSIEPMLVCDPGEVATASHHEGDERPTHDYADTEESHHEENTGSESHDHGDHENVCCSTLNATAQSGYEMDLTDRVWHPSAFPDADQRTALLVLEQRQPFPNRHVRLPDVVLTPVVCTDPAHPCHAPPVFI